MKTSLLLGLLPPVHADNYAAVMTVLHEKDDLDGSSREVMTIVGHHAAAVDSGASVYYFEEAGLLWK